MVFFGVVEAVVDFNVSLKKIIQKKIILGLKLAKKKYQQRLYVPIIG